ncbi:MAG: hypothetical protein ACI4MA_04800 [Treponema sp.]
MEKHQRTFFVEKIENQNLPRKTGVIKRRIGRYRIISADDKKGDFFFYMSEINKEYKNEKVDKWTKVDCLVVRNPNPSAESQRDKNERAKDLRLISV